MKSIASKISLAVVGGLVALNTGCGMMSQTEVKYFDLGSYNKESSNLLNAYQIRVVNATPVTFKMIYFNDELECVADDSNKFVQLPEEMLSRYLAARTGCQNFFSGDKTIDITINQFHINLSDMTVSMGIICRIQDGVNQVRFFENHLYQRKVESLSPEHFARAFAELFEEFANTLEKQAQKS